MSKTCALDKRTDHASANGSVTVSMQEGPNPGCMVKL